MAGSHRRNDAPDGGRPENVAATLDVLIIGAGFSGICAGIKLLERGSTSFRLFEKSRAVGGTWWENRYPGAACDVPSHFYCFSFNPNPNWSRVYSPQAEIKAYIDSCVDKYGLAPYIELGTKVVELRLDDTDGKWVATFADGRRIRALHVINGSGGLHQPLIPLIKGRDTFAGISMHTARWDASVDMAGKRVAVIGSAASAVQAVPEIARIAKSVVVFQRTPNYIAPRNDRAYTDREKRRFSRWPAFAKAYRWMIMARMELVLFRIVRRESWFGRLAAWWVNRHMRNSVNDASLHDKLTPDYAIGCKRILISDDFFAALNRDNVDLLTVGIDAIEATGIRGKDGRLHETDIIVYATGFDIGGHIRSIRVIGANGVSLESQWKDGARAYNGSCIAGFPNYYLVTGPNTGVGTTSVIHMIEQEIAYILKLLDLAGSQRLVSVTPAAQAAYNARIDADLERTVWLSGCRSWYIDANGGVSTLYPKNGWAFKRQLRKLRPADFEVLQRPGVDVRG